MLPRIFSCGIEIYLYMIKKKSCVTWKSSNFWKGKQKRPVRNANIFLFFFALYIWWWSVSFVIDYGGSKEDFPQRKFYLQWMKIVERVAYGTECPVRNMSRTQQPKYRDEGNTWNVCLLYYPTFSISCTQYFMSKEIFFLFLD